MCVVGQDWQLPALPRSRVHAHAFERDCEQSGGDLFPGGDNRIVFAGIVQHGRLSRPLDQLIGHARHGGDDDGHVVAGIDFALDVACHVADAVKIGDRRSAEFHHQTSHDIPGRAERR